MSVAPSSRDALRDIQYQVFTLQKDGTFYAEAERSETAGFSVHEGATFHAEGQQEQRGISTASGVYRYDNNTLTLTPHEGKPVSYQAKLIDSGNKLELEKVWKDRTAKMIFERRE
jgi:hypothetical protein